MAKDNSQTHSKKQIQRAVVLIERELEGIPSIKWEAFYLNFHLDPFALLWGLVEYKRFLEVGILRGTIIKQPHKSNPETFDAALYCQTKNFRSDLSELCDTCKLGQYIEDRIQKQIVFQAQQQKAILTNEKFKEYCDLQIADAQKSMMDMNLNMRRHETDRRYEANIPNTTSIYIWNKERIKTLNELQAFLPSTRPTTNDRINIFNPPMLLEDARKWFIQAVTRKNKQGKSFLTENDVDQFIKQAFIIRDMQAPKITANIGKGGYWTFSRLFSDYYFHCTTSVGNNRPVDERPAIRDEYIKLLTDNFEGFDFIEVKKNFGKKVGQAWGYL